MGLERFENMKIGELPQKIMDAYIREILRVHLDLIEIDHIKKGYVTEFISWLDTKQGPFYWAQVNRKLFNYTMINESKNKRKRSSRENI